MKTNLQRAWSWGLTLGLGLSLVGCGGGGGALADKENQETVSSISATTVGYRRTMTVSVTGGGLTDGLKVVVPEGCGAVTASTGGTQFSRSFTCKVDKLGALLVTVENAAGKRLGTLTLDVPTPQVTLITNKGTMVLELDPIKAPLSVNNFLDYVAEGFYRNVVFHRVDPAFGVIQAGGFRTGTALVPITVVKEPIKNESNNGLKNLQGTIAMARLAGTDTATSQFFINMRDNPDFDFQSEALPGYAVFGKVVTGLDVVDTIGAVETGPRNVTIEGNVTTLQNVPKVDVTITFASQSR
ncbi:peptidylprolyl isomerase [Inhella gelatinilytica]|uniref:peptidylprolyl isomerase n=1 Tax=Inhella gelatinilytica TaxID=2795030 RepID=A0A931IYB9_9BURK|nr:peptidylprolyl isomerase [Inhella gelatinilytica]MBH9553319.1 peptidylprolyl isomerase [Inhella gelatinilytica]